MFSRTVTDHWFTSHASSCAGEVGSYQIVVDDALPEHHSLVLLEPVARSGMLFATSATIERLGLSRQARIAGQALALALEAAHVELHGADHLFYLPVEEHSAVRSERVPPWTRRLHEADADAFAVLSGEAPEEDLDEAFVDLGHWLAFGTFVDGRLVSVASAYPWRGTRLADIGVVTLPGYRGRGCAKATVRALSAAALAQGYEPQYRCQLDNAPSVALAGSAGFARFGTWDVIDDRAN